MRKIATMIGLLMLAGAGGCMATVHTGEQANADESEMRMSNLFPVALWWTGQVQDQPEPLPSVRTRQLVIKVMSEAGLHPSHDPGGVQVPKDEVQRALEVLVTDERLAHTELEVHVIFFVPAGSGRRTEGGIEIPLVAPLPDHLNTVIESQ